MQLCPLITHPEFIQELVCVKQLPQYIKLCFTAADFQFFFHYSSLESNWSITNAEHGSLPPSPGTNKTHGSSGSGVKCWKAWWIWAARSRTRMWSFRRDAQFLWAVCDYRGLCHQFKLQGDQCHTSPGSALPISMNVHSLPAISLFERTVWNQSFKNLWLGFTQASPSNRTLQGELLISVVDNLAKYNEPVSFSQVLISEIWRRWLVP